GGLSGWLKCKAKSAVHTVVKAVEDHPVIAAMVVTAVVVGAAACIVASGGACGGVLVAAAEGFAGALETGATLSGAVAGAAMGAAGTGGLALGATAVASLGAGKIMSAIEQDAGKEAAATSRSTQPEVKVDGTGSRGHADEPAVGKNLPSAHAVAESVTHGSRSDGNAVIAGHGWRDQYAESFEMPQGTWLKCHCEDGMKLGDSAGLKIELGQPVPVTETILPGQRMKDILVGPPKGLNVATGSVVTSVPTPLSEMLKPGMGCVYLATCRELREGF
ncbi:putative adhesin, partial [Kitasatospora sp. SUK 42]|uniref:putative adhesin n=1 Tax=Kitasatospora sp. SUK 42 TaxID=1588882 RepID=UPI001C314C88